MTGREEIECQALYILSNIGQWKGPLAMECKAVFKRITKELRR